jgi:hypothetical protein
VELLSSNVVCLTTSDTEGHSLGHPEDQVKMISYLHFIHFVDIPGNLPSYDAFFCKKTLGSNGALKVSKTSSVANLL